MKLSFITPTSFIEEFQKQGDFTLALAHLLPEEGEVNEYQEQIQKIGLPIILDNGLFENHTPVELESLVGKACRVKAEVFFAPDYLYNKTETRKALEETIKFVKEKGVQVKIGAVVQADNIEDYIDQLLQFNEMEEVDLIGLSILSIPKSFGLPITESRIELMKRMIEISYESGVQWKKMHLLGIGNSYEDVVFAVKYCPWVVSNDSSCCFQSGLFGKRLGEKLEVPGGKIEEKVEFDLSSIGEDQKENIQKNINSVKNVIESLEKVYGNKS